MSFARICAVAMLVSVIITTIGLAIADAESHHLAPYQVSPITHA